MIVNSIDVPGVVGAGALRVLHNTPVEVFLGGSRRMAAKYSLIYGEDADGLDFSTSHSLFTMPLAMRPDFAIRIKPETDYDFYATYSEGLKLYLLDAGYEYSAANEYYLDTECVCILTMDNVQVVLRFCAEFYQTVFENIDLRVYHDLLWKSSPTAPDRSQIGPIFNMLFKIAHATKGDQ